MPFPNYARSSYATYGGHSPSASNPFLGPTRQIAQLVARMSTVQKPPASGQSPGASGGLL